MRLQESLNINLIRILIQKHFVKFLKVQISEYIISNVVNLTEFFRPVFKRFLFLKIPLCLVHVQTTLPEVTFTYGDTDFAYVQASPDINQPNAQTQCINWGGNLATIESAVEDSLLLHSIPDLETTFTCHIGLDKIGETDFVWIDGSTSSYRNWGTLLFNHPISTNNYDCVRHRYRSGGILSQGWLNVPCSNTRNCYFCSKPGKYY